MRGSVAAAVLLAVVGFVLPPGAMATALAEEGSALAAPVVTGVWLFKAGLLVNALLVLLVGRWARRLKTGDPLTTPTSRPPFTRGEAVALTVVLAVGLALRARALDQGLWFDEIATLVGHVRLATGELLSTFQTQNQHPLYSLLAHLSVAGFGETAWALRLPAVLFGVASLGALYLFGRQIANRREAMLATGLLALSYHHVWFSQNARGYTALLFFALVTSLLFLRLLGVRAWPGWGLPLAYAGFAALAVYTNASAALMVGGHGVIWGVLSWRARDRSQGAPVVVPLVALLFAMMLSFQLYAIVLPQFMETTLTPTMAGVSITWKSPVWLVAETARGLLAGVPGGWLTLAAGGVTVVVGTASYARRWPVALGVMAVPPILTALALLVLQHNLWPRLFFFATGFAALLLFRGLFALANIGAGKRGSAVAVVVGLVLIGASGATVPRAWRPKQDFAAARDFVEQQRGAGDAVVTVDLSAYPFRAYLMTDWIEVRSAAELALVEAGHRRIWMLYTFPTRLAAVRPDIWSQVQASYVRVAEFGGTVGDGAIVVVRRG